MKETDALIEKTKRVLQAKQSELAKLTDQLSKIRSAREARETERKTLRASFSKHETRIAALEDDLSGLTARRDMTGEQIRQIAGEISKATKARDHLATDVKAAHAATESEQKKLDDLLAQSQASEKNLHAQQELLAQAETDLGAIERTLAEKKSGLEILRQLNEEGEGLAQGSQAVLKGMDDPDRFRSAVVGSLVTQFDVDPKFIAAIEAALGRNLHAIILKDAASAEEIIARLTKKKLGQAALLIPKFGASSHESVRKTLPKGALAWAIDKIVAPRSLEPLMRQLLNGVVIFAKLDQALACKKDKPTLAMATLDGEFVSAEGIVFG